MHVGESNSQFDNSSVPKANKRRVSNGPSTPPFLQVHNSPIHIKHSPQAGNSSFQECPKYIPKRPKEMCIQTGIGSNDTNIDVEVNLKDWSKEVKITGIKSASKEAGKLLESEIQKIEELKRRRCKKEDSVPDLNTGLPLLHKKELSSTILSPIFLHKKTYAPPRNSRMHVRFPSLGSKQQYLGSRECISMDKSPGSVILGAMGYPETSFMEKVIRKSSKELGVTGNKSYNEHEYNIYESEDHGPNSNSNHPPHRTKKKLKNLSQRIQSPKELVITEPGSLKQSKKQQNPKFPSPLYRQGHSSHPLYHDLSRNQSNTNPQYKLPENKSLIQKMEEKKKDLKEMLQMEMKKILNRKERVRGGEKQQMGKSGFGRLRKYLERAKVTDSICLVRKEGYSEQGRKFVFPSTLRSRRGHSGLISNTTQGNTTRQEKIKGYMSSKHRKYILKNIVNNNTHIESE